MPHDTMHRATRIRILSSLVVSLGPVVLLAWPQMRRPDLPLLLCLGLLAASTVIINLVRDPISNFGRTGEDQASESLLAAGIMSATVWAALDVGRLHLTDHVPESLRWAGLIALLVGTGLRVWTVRVNRFFSNLVVIQAERDHHVVDHGPYAWVRHPGYATYLVILPAMGLALGSWSSLLLFGIAVYAVLRRTHREDRFLHDKLPRYPEYAAKVPARLVPWVY